jgi:hypothetical protein
MNSEELSEGDRVSFDVQAPGHAVYPMTGFVNHRFTGITVIKPDQEVPLGARFLNVRRAQN